MYFQRLILPLSTLLLTFAASLAAADSAKEGAIRQTYYPEDFSQFVPRSALDLVKQVPGFSVDEGGGVEAGQIVVTMEAMKMEYRIEAPRDGVVEKILVEAEQLVDQGTLLVKLNEASDD